MLVVNQKKSKRLKNRTKYFDPDTSKSHVRFSSPDSYQSRQIKIEGYETRLYWQFKYCEDHDGQAYFYTLTYNDGAMPKYKLGKKYDKSKGVYVPEEFSCFDYEDLRYLFTGGFNKQLLRRYGTKLKYFVGAELGDGKGSRGMHNNPHYHVIFFLENAHHEKFPYIKITPEDFRHLVKTYWQGFDENTDGYHDYNDAKYGIAKEGDNVGKVSDYRAISYCAKYVCKDAKLKQYEDKVERKIRFMLTKEAKNSVDTFKGFLHDVVYDMYNTPLNASKTEWVYSDKKLLVHLLPERFAAHIDIFGEVPDTVIDYVKDVTEVIRKYHLWNKYNEYLNASIEDDLKAKISEYRNRYSNKCRISQGVGDYALEFIGDKMNPTFKVPSKKGFKNRPMSQYYYRKLFTDVIKPTDTNVFGKTREYPAIRVLNEDGIKYKLYHLQERINKMAGKARNNLSLLLDNEELFEKMKASDINTEVWCSHEDFVKQVEKLKLNGERWRNLFTAYAEYKLVYEDRYFKIPSFGSDDVFDFPAIDVRGDYERFLIPSVYSVSRSDLRLDLFLEGNSEDYLPYSQHPYFLCYLGIFNILDMCADYWFIQKDDKAQREAEAIAATKRFHSERKLKDFYSQFK